MTYTAGKLVVVHGPADPALDAVLAEGGLRRVLQTDHVTVWIVDGPGTGHSPAAMPARPANPAGPQRLLLAVAQAAAVLGVGRTTAYELVHSGQLEVVHVGRCARVPADALPHLVSQLRAGGGLGTTCPATRSREVAARPRRRGRAPAPTTSTTTPFS